MILQTNATKRMNSIAKTLRGLGCDPSTGRQSAAAATAIARANAVSPVHFGDLMLMLRFVFYLIIGGRPYVVFVQQSLIVEHFSSTTAPDSAALEALVQKNLVPPRTLKPTVIHAVKGIYFVKVDEGVLRSKGSTIFGSKLYSLIDPLTGKTQGGKIPSVFEQPQCQEMMAAFLSKVQTTPPLPPLASFASGGKCDVVDRLCDHKLCKKNLPKTAVLIFPVFEYKYPNMSKESVLILNFKNGVWDIPNKIMDPSDKLCWLATIMRVLLNDVKITLSYPLNDSNVKTGKPFKGIPTFFVMLDQSMVVGRLSREVLNQKVLEDNAMIPGLSACDDVTQEVGFFVRRGGALIPVPRVGLESVPGDPPNFSRLVLSWLLENP